MKQPNLVLPYWNSIVVKCAVCIYLLLDLICGIKNNLKKNCLLYFPLSYTEWHDKTPIGHFASVILVTKVNCEPNAALLYTYIVLYYC